MSAPARVLITGRPGIGKTTTIQRVLDRIDRPAGGFTSSEIREDGRRVGFAIETLAGERVIMAHVDRPGSPRISRYGVDVAAIESVAVAAIRRAVAAGELVVVDEIGPMELLADAFPQAVRHALAADVPFLASIVARRHPFTDELKQRRELELLKLTRDNRERIVEHLIERFQH